ncbi:putative exodeoxyribonuclease V, beta subunit [Burkholderia mallei]|nr:putative exodeoxyribonuclease V, beta subunit [Burkholderia mallei]KOT08078.1 putative exodeoxyribonuclease V, beta subunit [Burkholderia mallei]KOT25733.1 exodeoxyribonuclease V, beta subunit domain protein [Burkholderia mallei]
MRLHEHRDAGRRERLAAERHRALARAPHQPRDFRRACMRGVPLRVALGQHVVAGGQRPYAEVARAGKRIGRVDKRRAHARARAHRFVIEPVEHERARVRAEHAVARIDDRGRRALVHRERVARGRPRARGEIRVQVRRAEAVDRLLRIADEKERAGGREDRIEDRELQRVRILEFVDERGRIARAQRLAQPRMRVERAIQVREQIVERYDAARALALRELGGRRVEPLLDERQPARALRGLERGDSRLERLRDVEERVARRRAALFRRFLERGLRELERRARQRGHRTRLLEITRPRVERLAHRLRLVRALVQRRLRVGEQRAEHAALVAPDRGRRIEVRARGAFRAVVGRVQAVPAQSRQRLLQPPRELRVERRRPRAVLDEPLGERRIGRRDGLDTRAPEIGGQLEAQRAVVRFHLERERHRRRERRFLQRPLAERVDRVDRRLVECAQRATHALRRRLRIEPALGRERRLEQARDERIAAVVARVERVRELREARANPFVQLGRRRLRERDDENLVRAEILFEQQAHVQRADVPGLAGARGRLDLVHTVERTREHVELARRRAGWRDVTHDALRRCSTSGSNTRCASAPNGSSSDGFAPRHASASDASSASPATRSLIHTPAAFDSLSDTSAHALLGKNASGIRRPARNSAASGASCSSGAATGANSNVSPEPNHSVRRGPPGSIAQ